MDKIQLRVSYTSSVQLTGAAALLLPYLLPVPQNVMAYAARR